MHIGMTITTPSMTVTFAEMTVRRKDMTTMKDKGYIGWRIPIATVITFVLQRSI